MFKLISKVCMLILFLISLYSAHVVGIERKIFFKLSFGIYIYKF